MGGPVMSALTTVAACFALIAAIIAGLTAWWLFTDPAATVVSADITGPPISHLIATSADCGAIAARRGSRTGY